MALADLSFQRATESWLTTCQPMSNITTVSTLANPFTTLPSPRFRTPGSILNENEASDGAPAASKLHPKNKENHASFVMHILQNDGKSILVDRYRHNHQRNGN